MHTIAVVCQGLLASVGDVNLEKREIEIGETYNWEYLTVNFEVILGEY